VIAGSGASAANAHRFTDFDGRAPLLTLRKEQLAIAAKVSSRDAFGSLHTIGGVDVSYEGDRGFAVAVVLRGKDLAVVDEARARLDVDFPYVPTYLAQREFPLIRAAFERLKTRPTVLLVDGHGRLHPARCGVACFVGVKLGVPTVGVAKNPLTGTMSHHPSIGESVPVRIGGQILGYAVRTSTSARPLFVSVGHRVSLRSAVRIVRSACVTRQPEPLRLAHVLATEFKRRKRKKDSKRV
jgi:deoxyribonuclease V